MDPKINWVRDEVILALDLYLRIKNTKGRRWSPVTPEVVELSQVLNSLPIHAGKLRGASFRNPTGVSMKLSNILTHDPDYTGKGLRGGNKGLEGEVWRTYANSPVELAQVASNIRAAVTPAFIQEIIAVDDDPEFAAPEGQVLLRLHRARERNPSLVAKKKKQALKTKGCLECEVCTFTFRQKYGHIGSNFIECHHRKPLAELEPGTPTKLADLALVCSNCHRMLHIGSGRTIAELQGAIAVAASSTAA